MTSKRVRGGLTAGCVRALLLAALLLHGPGGPGRAQGAPAEPADRADGLEPFLDGLFARLLAKEHVPGAVVVVVADGKVKLAKGYGRADLEAGTPVSPERTIFRVGSITKVFTATALMQLAERKLVRLDDDVNKYLKDPKVPETYPQPVTLSHLLTHTAGFDEINSGRHAPGAEKVLPLREFLRGRLVRVRPPGEVISYGTYGITLAGHLVEEVSNVEFRQYLRKNIFDPLGMGRTTVGAVPAQMLPDLAVGYVHGDGKYRPAEFEYFHSYPASDVNSTAADMARFMIAHLQGGVYEGARILGEGATREMQRQHFTAHPLMHGRAYGWAELRQNGQRAVMHGGSMEGYAALLFLLPERNWGLFVAGNRETGALAEQVKNALMDRYFPYKVQPDPPRKSSGDLSRFAGTYRSTEYCHTCSGIRDFFVNRKLAPSFSVKANDDGTLEVWGERLVRVEPLLFKVAGDRGYVAFREDRRGEITYMLIGASSYERVR